MATLLARANPQGSTNIDFRNQALASAMARGQLAYYEILGEQGQLRQLRTWRDVESHLREWKSDPARCPLGYILSMEGADPILSPDNVGFWWERGLRAAGISHFGVSSYAHGTGTPGGLTPRGPDLLRAMRAAGMALDVTHLADDAFWQALEIFDGPVWASHSNCRALVPGDRQFTDDQLRALIERDAVIGAVLDIWMLYPPFEVGVTPNTVVSLENCRRPHRSHLPAGREHAPRGRGQRSRWRIRDRADPARRRHDCGPAKAAGDSRRAWLHAGGHRRDHARQLAPHLQARAAGLSQRAGIGSSLPIGDGSMKNQATMPTSITALMK